MKGWGRSERGTQLWSAGTDSSAVQLAARPTYLHPSAAQVVELRGRVLEKPDDAAHAIEMLTALAGQVHQVHTGVALVMPRAAEADRVLTFYETTHVTFADLDASEIEAYVATGEAFGRAGAYGIQGPAGAWVSRLEGCYFNVMGFPLHRFARVVSERIASGQLKLEPRAPF